MGPLRIDLDRDNLEAVLSVQEPGRQWSGIVRIMQEQDDEARQVSGTELRLPWWAFIAARKALGYVVARDNITVDFTAAAQTALQKVNDREETLEVASSVKEISDAVIDSKLKDGGFTRSLKSFQRRNLRRLCRLPVGADYSVPGSGKTSEALAFFAFFRTKNARLLVVAPKNAFAAWEEQLQLCMEKEDRSFVRLIGGRRAIERTLSEHSPVYMLVTYEQFPTAVDVITRYLRRFDAFLVLDESHRIKGGTARVRANSILRASQVASQRLVLSGTPLPNSVADLVPQFRFIAPELDADEASIAEQMSPFFVRTTKKDLGLPDPIRSVVSIPMAEMQRRLYELLKSEAARDAKSALSRGEKRAFRQIGRSATRLLQFVSNPSLLIGKVSEFDSQLGAVVEEGDSPKLEWVCRRARQLARQKRKVIIWSSFVQNVEIVSERLADLGADYIHGGVEASSEAEQDSREAKIKRFHDDRSAMVLVANPAACSEGISLHTVCHHAIYLDRNYNVAQYIQSEDRIHRIGSDEQKYVEILASPDSVDESVGRRLNLKIGRMADVLNDPGLRLNPVEVDPDSIDLDSDDVIDLFEHLRSPQEIAA